MGVHGKRGLVFSAAAVLALPALAFSARADEIHLKDGRKLNGVIVGYEDNMFKVKTDYGYELVDKDKITSIIPTTPAAKAAPDSAAKKDAPQHPPKPAAEARDARPEPAVATAANTGAAATPTNASVKSGTPAASGKSEKTSAKSANAAAKPDPARELFAQNYRILSAPR